MYVKAIRRIGFFDLNVKKFLLSFLLGKKCTKICIFWPCVIVFHPSFGKDPERGCFLFIARLFFERSLLSSHWQKAKSKELFQSKRRIFAINKYEDMDYNKEDRKIV